MWAKIVGLIKQKKVASILIASFLALGVIGAANPASTPRLSERAVETTVSDDKNEADNSEDLTAPRCDGVSVTSDCEDESGAKYSKYIYHEAVDEVTEDVYHPAVPEKSHTVYHEAVYKTRQVQDCIRTSISYKNGTCALSQCRDGSYSGSSGRGTCSYHGGVARSGGPWYVTTTEEYLETPAWTETVVDEPAKEAWTEVVVVSPAIEAYYEKVLAE